MTTLICFDARSQGTFGNLNFEFANVPFVPQGQFGRSVSVSDGIPGWTAYIGGNQVGSILHNDRFLSSAGISIFGPQWFPSQILEGNYTVLLLPGDSAGMLTTAAIAQTGLIPSGSRSLVFYTGPASSLQATFAGQPISLVPLGANGSYQIVGGDITPFAGQTGELRFTALIGPLGGGGGFLDNIQFSTQTVPEPSVLSLFAIGLSLLGWRFFSKDGESR